MNFDTGSLPRNPINPRIGSKFGEVTRGTVRVPLPRTNYASSAISSSSWLLSWRSYAAKNPKREKKNGSSGAFSGTLLGRKLIGPNRGWLFHHPVHGIMADSHVSLAIDQWERESMHSKNGTRPLPNDVPRLSSFLASFLRPDSARSDAIKPHAELDKRVWFIVREGAFEIF